MSIIATVVKGALALDQQVQALVHKLAHGRATSYFQMAQETEEQAIQAAEFSTLQAEKQRIKDQTLLVIRHRVELQALQQRADNKLDLIDGRKQQMLGKASQQRAAAADWQSTAMNAAVAEAKALRAADAL